VLVKCVQIQAGLVNPRRTKFQGAT